MSTSSTEHLPSYLNPNDPGPWAVFLEQVDRVTPYLGEYAQWVDTLKHPERTLIVNIPVKMDDGRIEHFEGYRVQHNLSCGPGKIVLHTRSEEHTSELQSRGHLVCRLLLEKKKLTIK